VKKHADLGDGLLPWAIGLFLVTGAVWWLGRRTATATEAATEAPAAAGTWWKAPRFLHIATVVLTVVISVGAVVDVYRIGESGAKASWHDSYDKTANG